MRIIIDFIKRNSLVFPFFICAFLAYYNISDCNKVTSHETEQNYKTATIFYFALALLFLILIEYLHYYKKNNKDKK